MDTLIIEKRYAEQEEQRRVEYRESENYSKIELPEFKWSWRMLWRF